MASSELHNPEEPGAPHSGSPRTSNDGEQPGVVRSADRDAPTSGPRSHSVVADATVAPPTVEVTDGEHQLERESDNTTEDPIHPWSADPPPDAGCITHYYGEFKGQALDLYTDGVRWAPGDRKEGDEIVSQKPDRSHPDDPTDQPASGDDLLEPAGEDASRADRFRRELYRHSDDAQDAIEKNSNLVHDVFARPPASGHEVSPVNAPYVSQPPQYSLEAGAAATAALALGIVLDRGVRRLARHQTDRTEGE